MRVADLRTLYTSTNVDEVRQIVKKYRISFVVVGSLEKKDFPAGAFPAGLAFRRVFDGGGTAVYAVSP
jgi:uncharacterized membrane protein